MAEETVTKKIRVNEIPELFGLDPIESEVFKGFRTSSECLVFLSSYMNKHIIDELKEILATKYAFIFNDRNDVTWRIGVHENDIHFIGYYKIPKNIECLVEVEFVS